MKSYCSAIMYTGIIFASFQAITKEIVIEEINSQKVIMTAKERLGKKASDDQRVNNCKVPVEKRGTKPRSDKCIHRK